MLSLESPLWANLTHAYGNASDVPSLLEALEALPTSDGNAEPWFSIWSSLAHQGDVYDASFAAVPHVVGLLESSPALAPIDFFLFPTWVEICRQRNNIEVPVELKDDYNAAIAKLSEIVCKAHSRMWRSSELSCVLAAFAISKGDLRLGAAIFELTPDVLQDFQSWLESR